MHASQATTTWCCLQVASLALAAILPAWAAAGKSLQELAAAVVAALPRVSPHRRLSLLAALVAALPQVGGPLSSAKLSCTARLSKGEALALMCRQPPPADSLVPVSSFWCL